ncbi:hypothetical protein TUMEXPCC7403_01065 [Tumidithrix helvetica PCC 7403]|uniref:eCIS core domain-containing protein n=1 Tax=Tumidithrix helvetica TaxID=3457545 RepID=UPI003C8B16E7
MGKYYTSAKKKARSGDRSPPISTGIPLLMRDFAPPQQSLPQPKGEDRTAELGHRLENISFEPRPQVDIMARKWEGIRAAYHAKQVQAKLAIGAVGDKYEQEADKVASQVAQTINTPENIQREEEEQVQTKPLDSIQRDEALEEEDEELQMKPLSDSIQREEALEEEDEEIQMKPLSDSIQRDEAPEEEDEEIQMKPALQRREAVNGDDASEELESSIQQAKGSGQPLDPKLQAKMGQAMGADFSSVKVHTDSQSDQLNQSIQAKAFTTGQDVFFRQGAFDPSSRSGQELIAHELTHVVQQNGVAVQRSVGRENDGKSRSGTNDKGSSVNVNGEQTRGSIQRKITWGRQLQPEWTKYTNGEKSELFESVESDLVELVIKKYPYLEPVIKKEIMKDLLMKVDSECKPFRLNSRNEIHKLVGMVVSRADVAGIKVAEGIKLASIHKVEWSEKRWKERRKDRENSQKMAEIKEKNQEAYEKLQLILYAVENPRQLDAIKVILDQTNSTGLFEAITKASDFAIEVATKNFEFKERLVELDDRQYDIAMKKLYGRDSGGTREGKRTKQEKDMRRDREYKLGKINTADFFHSDIPKIMNDGAGFEQQRYGLSDAEVMAINAFSMSSYKAVNPGVHGGAWWEKYTEKMTPEQTQKLAIDVKDHVTLLKSGLKKLPDVSATCYRGESLSASNYAAKYGAGKLEPKTFQSNSKSKSIAENFRNETSGKYKILLQMELTRGKDIKAFSNVKVEEELVTSPNAQFEIEKTNTIADDDTKLVYVHVYTRQNR